MKRVALLSAALLLSVTASFGSGVLVEAESFRDKGGWAVDQQFMDQMGSPYLIAHGMGKPVADAVTTVEFPETGTYRVYVRTFNWVAPWYDGEGPESSPSGSAAGNCPRRSAARAASGCGSAPERSPSGKVRSAFR